MPGSGLGGAVGLAVTSAGATSHRLPFLITCYGIAARLGLVTSHFGLSVIAPLALRYQNANTWLARLPVSIDAVLCLLEARVCHPPDDVNPLGTGIGVGCGANRSPAGANSAPGLRRTFHAFLNIPVEQQCAQPLVLAKTGPV